jgi:hypothetical protein
MQFGPKRHFSITQLFILLDYHTSVAHIWIGSLLTFYRLYYLTWIGCQRMVRLSEGIFAAIHVPAPP